MAGGDRVCDFHIGKIIGEKVTTKLEKRKIKPYEVAFRIYYSDEIRIVHERHNYNPGTVLYSEDDGCTWKLVPMEFSKWDVHKWVFCFIKIT